MIILNVYYKLLLLLLLTGDQFYYKFVVLILFKLHFVLLLFSISIYIRNTWMN